MDLYDKFEDWLNGGIVDINSLFEYLDKHLPSQQESWGTPKEIVREFLQDYFYNLFHEQYDKEIEDCRLAQQQRQAYLADYLKGRREGTLRAECINPTQT